jgi:hypothetical protein
VHVDSDLAIERAERFLDPSVAAREARTSVDTLGAHDDELQPIRSTQGRRMYRAPSRDGETRCTRREA